VNGASTLASFQGVDLSMAAAGVLRRPQPPAGVPAGDPAVWDLSVAGSSAAGIASTASASFRMPLFEKNGFVSACTTSATCCANGAAVWSTPQWQLENLLTFAARSVYATRTLSKTYVLGAFTIDIGQGGNPPGWAEYSTLLGIGSPPPSQYVWESFSEIAQVALHRVQYGGATTFLAEGQA